MTLRISICRVPNMSQLACRLRPSGDREAVQHLVAVRLPLTKNCRSDIENWPIDELLGVNPRKPLSIY
jgi:hypothetical protein